MKCIFETDAKVVVDACKGDRGRSYFDIIVMNCIELIKHFDDVLVVFVHRSVNGVALLLARETHSVSDFQEWHGIALDFIHYAIVSESV